MTAITEDDIKWAQRLASRPGSPDARRNRDDLAGVAVLAMLDAASRHGLAGDRLRAAAYRGVCGAVRRTLRADRVRGGTGLYRSLRLGEPFPVVLSLDRVGDDGQTLAQELFHRPEHTPIPSLDGPAKARLLDSVRRLPSPHRAIISQHFGVLSYWGRPISVESIARERSRTSPNRDWSSRRVQQIISEGLSMLRESLAREEVA